MTRKFLFVTLLLAFLAALAWSLPAAADSITPTVPTVTVSGTLTADNGFVLYYGPKVPAADGSDLQFIAEGDYWPSPVSFKQDVPVGDYLYVVAWNLPDGAMGLHGSDNPQAWLGAFTIGNTTIYSDLKNWQYIYTTSGNPSIGNAPSPDLLSQSGVASAIASGGLNKAWQLATADSGNTSPNSPGNKWSNVHDGPIAGISESANWIWFDQFVGGHCPNGTIDAAGNYTSSIGGYAVFRAEVVSSQVVPIPASALLLGSGLMGLGLLGWRRQRLIG